METVLGLSGFHWALLGAALATIGGGIGSAIGITYIANVAAGIVTEDAEKYGPVLPLVAMPGTQGIYGFVAAVLVIMFFGLLGGEGAKLTAQEGFQIFCACLPVCFTGMLSGIFQGMTAMGAAGMVAKRTEEAGRALIFPVFVEFYAVLGLIVSILLLMSIQAAS